MGGLHFIHLGFLAAAAAAVVPLVIHLLFRQKARRVEVGTLRFLRVALRNNARRRKIRRWLLLALRVAGVLLLALLFARPYRDVPGGAGVERAVVVMLDRSASMGAVNGGANASPFARARRAATAILADLPDGTAAHLAYYDADGVAPAPDLTPDPNLQPGPAASDHGKALAWARDILARSGRPSRRAVLLTDLQRTGLVRSSLEGRFPADVTLELDDVGRPGAKNLAVEDVQAGRTDLRPGVPVVVSARLFNAGPFVARGVAARLHLEGPEAVDQEEAADPAAEGRRVVRFEVPLKTPGLYWGWVEIAADDPLAFDDRRYLAFEARAADRVLLVDGEPGPSVFGNETYYLETALRLRLPGEEGRGRGPASPYEPTRVAGVGSLPELAPYRAVVLCNVADVPTAAANALARYVDAGGTLVVFGGDRLRPGALGTLGRGGLLPATVEGPSEPGAARLATWSREHPIFRPFDDPQAGDLRTLAFRRWTRLAPAAGGKVLAETTGGRPWLIEGAKGRVLACAAAADAEWGDWAIQRLYLPLIHQMMGYLCGRLPDGRVRPALATAAEPPGIATAGEAVVVRNVDPRESSLDRATIEEFRRAFDLPAIARVAPRDSRDEPSPPSDGRLRPDEWWHWLAWGLLIVLVAETFVANRTTA